MRRLFWLALGAVVGVLLVRRVPRVAEQYTPTGVARSAAELGEGLREVAAVIRDAMAEREQELRAALGVEAASLPPGAAQSAAGDPTR